MTGAGNIAQRDRTFDIMKGIGILLVITAHFFSWNHPILGRSITSFHMPMFFIVAGYFSKFFTTWSDAKLKIGRYARRPFSGQIRMALILLGEDCLSV